MGFFKNIWKFFFPKKEESKSIEVTFGGETIEVAPGTETIKAIFEIDTEDETIANVSLLEKSTAEYGIIISDFPINLDPFQYVGKTVIDDFPLWRRRQIKEKKRITLQWPQLEGYLI